MGIAELLRRLIGLPVPEDPVKLEVEDTRRVARKAVKRIEEVIKECRKVQRGEPGGLVKAAEEFSLEYSSIGESQPS